jgi:amino acid transporter
VRASTSTQNVFTVTKVLALGIIIIAGIVCIFLGSTHYLDADVSFSGSKLEPGSLSLATYSGVFSFAGWNYLNFVTEELKDPYKNLPRAIYISLPAVTAIYMLANVAYFTVLSPDDVLDSNAVAVSFAEKVMGPAAFLMPIFVACSTVGSLNGILFASSRMFFAGARDGQLPELLSMINMKYITPMPSLLILGGLSLLMLVSNDIFVLINYTSFAESAVVAMAVAGLLWLRWREPNRPRPIKMNLLIPILFFLMCLFLLIFPFFVSPFEVLIGLAIILSGIPVYFVFVWRGGILPEGFHNKWVDITHCLQRLFWCVPDKGAMIE